MSSTKAEQQPVVIKDQYSDRSKGFGFVEMPDKAEAPGCHKRSQR
jgi:hypothetical protein